MALLFIALLVVLVLLFLKMRGGKPNSMKQVTRAESGLASSAELHVKHSKPFHGVRVIDFSTVLAGPIAARALADMGAEVIKVEEKKGDPFRKTFLEYEPGRTQGSMFEMANLGKSSISLDLKKESGKEELLKLLENADVLITNLRVDALKRLGLDYEQLSKLFPLLIYCRLTAYGAVGPDKSDPGYDVGAFWAATGMGCSIQPEGYHGVYPAGYGDISTGSSLVAGVAMKLASRLETGQGGLVDSSLLRGGLFCMSSVLSAVSPDPSNHVENLSRFLYQEKEESTHLACKDGNVAILGSRIRMRNYDTATDTSSLDSLIPKELKMCDVATIENALQDLARLPLQNEDGSSAATRRVSSFKEILEKVSTLSKADVLQQLKMNQVPCCIATELLNVSKFLESPSIEDILHDTPKESDLSLIPQKPYRFYLNKSSSSGTSSECWSGDTTPQIKAPSLGVHSEDVKLNSWTKRHESCDFPTTMSNESKKRTDQLNVKPLTGLVVVEWNWGDGVTASAIGRQFSDAGATVYSVLAKGRQEPTQDADWSKLDEQYNFNKEKVEVDLSGNFESNPQASPLYQLILEKRATCFISDAPLSQLLRQGLNMKDNTSLSSHVVFGVVTPWGLQGSESPRGELGAFWSQSGMGATVTGCIDAERAGFGEPHRLRALPFMMGECITALHAFAAVTSALLRQRRIEKAVLKETESGTSASAPEAIVVDTSLQRSGTWSLGCLVTLILVDHHKAKLWDVAVQEIPLSWPLPTLTAVISKDGVSIQLLGLDFAKHLKPTLMSLGAPPSLWGRLAWTFLTKVLPSKAPTRILKLVPLLEVVNGFVLKQCRSRTYKELSETFKEYDVWHTLVRSPGQALAYEQACQTNSFREGVKNVGSKFVNSPIQFE